MLFVERLHDKDVLFRKKGAGHHSLVEPAVGTRGRRVCDPSRKRHPAGGLVLQVLDGDTVGVELGVDVLVAVVVDM